MALRLLLTCIFFQACFAVDSLRFLVIGDWGGLPEYPYDTPVETSVAKQMDKVTTMYSTQFNLALGDNFYFDGVSNVTDKRFTYTFENVYYYESLQNPWYLVAGNHDHNGNVSAQIAYSKKSKRWNFPDYYYKLAFPISAESYIDILMLDTILLCGNTDDRIHEQPKGPKDLRAAATQWQWIETQLQQSKVLQWNSLPLDIVMLSDLNLFKPALQTMHHKMLWKQRADYLIVAGHFPVYSIAEHGPTQCLVDQLKPLLLKYNVTAYFNGHDHNLQHIREEEQGQEMNYFTTGAANFVDTSLNHEADVPKDWVRFHWARVVDLGGFAYLEATPNNMTFIFLDGKKTPLYQYVLEPRSKQKV